MNELFDKLIIRMVFTAFICGILYAYKYAHRFLYPSSRTQMFKRFYPSKNGPDTLHLFARLIGIAILFSEFNFYMSEGIIVALFKFFVHGTIMSVIYLISIYIIESIVLYNFEYSDEIVKRKNFAYAIVSFAHAVAIAYILKVVINVSGDSLALTFFLWLFTIVLMGFATKTFKILSKLSFNGLVIQKNIGVAVSYLGFIWGWTLLISSAIHHELTDIKWYVIQVILKILLSVIILPLFVRGIKWIFKLQDDLVESETKGTDLKEIDDVEFGYGLYEGATFFTCCYLTIIITEQISFGTFYPIF